VRAWIERRWREGGKAVAAVFAAIVLVRTIFLVTYPPNTGADCITYYRMLVGGKSNLIHAPGYPYLVGLPIRSTLELTGRRWVVDVYPVATEYLVVAFQHLLSLAALWYLFVTADRVFGRGAALLAVLIHGMRPSTLGFVSCFYPEWLQADLFVVSLCTAYWALREPWGSRKVVLYVGSFTAFAWCWLSKFNAIFLLPGLAVVLLADRIGWRRKLAVASIAGTVAALNVCVFVLGFHRQSTGTTALSRDHAWVLLTALGPWAPDRQPQAEAGVWSKRLIYLNSVLPWNPANAGPYWHVDQTPATERAKWRAKYAWVLSADEPALDKLLADVPSRREPYDFYSAFLPVSWNIGLEEGDRLGTRVFVEHVISYPGKYAAHILSEFFKHLWSWPTTRLCPINAAAPEYGPPDNLGFCARVQQGERPTSPWWYSRPVVWRPGIAVVRWLEVPFGLPTMMVALLVAGFVALSARSVVRGSRDAKWVAGCVLGSIVLVYLAGSHLVFFRWKEAQTVLPLVSVLFAAGAIETWRWLLRCRSRGAATSAAGP
jgi:hypothetical protein